MDIFGDGENIINGFLNIIFFKFSMYVIWGHFDPTLTNAPIGQ
jgi:hypothetical protein